MIELQGLTRATAILGPWPAAPASSAIFACLHPPIALLPVFCLGVAAASTYARTRSLLAPMLAHATYNASIVAVQLLLHLVTACAAPPTSAIADCQVIVCS